MSLNVKIVDRAARNRLHHDLLRMREQIASLADGKARPNAAPSWVGHQTAILKSARGNARDLAAAIKDWDRRNPVKRQRRAKGKRA